MEKRPFALGHVLILDLLLLCPWNFTSFIIQLINCDNLVRILRRKCVGNNSHFLPGLQLNFVETLC